MARRDMDIDIEIGPVAPRHSSPTLRRKRDLWFSDTGPLVSNSIQQETLLQVLGLLGTHRCAIFSVEPGLRWNLRAELGSGASFDVAEADMPIWSALSYLRYRDLHVQNSAQESYFIDHTNTRWSSTTKVAFKARSGRPLEPLEDVLTELRVLLHAPLQNHPNIVKLLGVAWVMESAVKLGGIEPPAASTSPRPHLEERASLEIPAIVLERASHGSLDRFLRVQTPQGRISLNTKLRLCSDVLNAISSLHVCGIVHGDVKCENTLIFDGPGAYTENWIAKLTDFGHARLELDDSTSDGEVLGIPSPGTMLYSSPELDNNPQPCTAENFKKSDIWGWGMLLWRVMIDGTAYKDEAGQLLEDREAMKAARAAPGFASMVSRSCLSYQQNNYHSETENLLASEICKILKATLAQAPSSRPNSLALLDRLEVLSGLRYVHVNQPGPALPVQDIPFPDLSAQYYDLIAFSTLPRQVFEKFSAIMTGPEDATVILQLGLCHLVGFGTATDPPTGVSFVDQAAKRGLLKAQAVSARVHFAFDIPLAEELLPFRKEWLLAGVSSGSLIASQDLDLLFPGARINSENTVKGQWGQLWRSTPSNSHTDANPDIEDRGYFGDSALHWAIFESEHVLNTIAIELLRKGADLHCETYRACPLSKENHFCNTIPAHTTAVEWAILKDDANLVHSIYEVAEVTSPELRIRYVCFALRYQCSRTLRYLLEHQRPQDELRFYSHPALSGLNKFSPFYFAVRPDLFNRMFRFQQDRVEDEPSISSNVPPFVAREAGIIRSLLELNYTTRLQPEESFNCLHLTVALGSSETLKTLLANKTCQEFIDEQSQFSGSPLQEAILRGNKPDFDLLLDSGASIKPVWIATGAHALHICAMNPSDIMVSFAECLIEADPSCLKRRDWQGNTPLHCAAQYGHESLSELLIDKGASLLTFNRSSLSPLGLSVRNRFLATTRLLMQAHARRGIPQVACGSDFLRTGSMVSGSTVCVLPFLISPGPFSPDGGETAGPKEKGCGDKPFSELSMKLLTVILDEYRPHLRPPIWQPFYILRRILRPLYFLESGIYPTVRTENEAALHKIIDSGHFKPDFRDLVHRAYHWHFIKLRSYRWEDELLGLEKINGIIRYLEGLEDAAFRELRELRTSYTLFGFIWSLYYRVYGDFEEKEYKRRNHWRFDGPNRHRDLLDDAQVSEISQWYRSRFSLYIYMYAILLAIVVPLIVYFAALANNPQFEDTKSSVGSFVTTLTLLIINSLWAKWMRIAAVYYGHLRRRRFDSPRLPTWQDRWHSSPLRKGRQTLLCLSALCLSVYTCHRILSLPPSFRPSGNWDKMSDREHEQWSQSGNCRVCLIFWVISTQLFWQFIFLLSRLFSFLGLPPSDESTHSSSFWLSCIRIH